MSDEDNKQSWSDLRQSLRVPAFCPQCGRLMKGSKSNHSYYNFDCCSDCFIAFVEDREERWKEGWRPSEEQLKSYYDRLDGRN